MKKYPNLEKICVNLVALILLLLPTYLIRFKFFGIPSTFLEIYVYFVFVIFLLNALIHKQKIFAFKPMIVIPFIFLGAISAYYSISFTSSIGQVKAIFFDGLLALIMFYHYREDLVFRSRSFFAFITSGVIVALWGILQSIGLVGLIAHQTTDPTIAEHLAQGRILGPYESPNYLAMYLAPLVVMLIINYIGSKEIKLPKILFWIILAILLLTLVLTQSVSAIIAIIIVLSIYLIVKWETKLKWLWFGLLAVLVVIGTLLLNQYSPKSGSIAARREIYYAAIETGKTHQLYGIGINNFPDYFEKVEIDGRLNYEAMHPHNVFLAFWVYMGLPGLILFLFAIYLCFKGARQPNKKMYLFALLVILVNGLTDTTIFKNDLSFVFWYVAAFLI